MKPFIRNAVFFIGWILSPLTTWNDAFVNIPLSYLLANIIVRLVNVNFPLLVLASYWATNIIGLGLMYAAGKNAIKDRGGAFKAVSSMIITTALYSIIILILGRIGILKPF